MVSSALATPLATGTAPAKTTVLVLAKNLHQAISVEYRILYLPTMHVYPSILHEHEHKQYIYINKKYSYIIYVISYYTYVYTYINIHTTNT